MKIPDTSASPTSIMKLWFARGIRQLSDSKYLYITFPQHLMKVDAANKSKVFKL